MIYLLWTTIRPKTFLKTLKTWRCLSESEDNYELNLALEDSLPQDKRDEIENELEYYGFNYSIIYTDHKIPGVTYHSRQLALSIKDKGKDSDIVVFSSDDFFPPNCWDTKLIEQFKNYSGAIIFNDSNFNPVNSVVQIPIMDFATLRKLNFIIYHPVYTHFCSDIELHDVLSEMKLLKDLTISRRDIVFEHRHYTNGKRRLDKHDALVRSFSTQDRLTYAARKHFTLEQKLECH